MTAAVIGDPRLPRRFWAKVVEDPDTGCWMWTGGITADGYGRFKVAGKTRFAHRLAYEALVGPILAAHLDHFVCETPGCANPSHVRPASVRENTLRGNTLPAANLAKLECPAGHPYDESNTYIHDGKRSCRACHCATQRRYLEKRSS